MVNKDPAYFFPTHLVSQAQRPETAAGGLREKNQYSGSCCSEGRKGVAIGFSRPLSLCSVDRGPLPTEKVTPTLPAGPTLQQEPLQPGWVGCSSL